MWSSTASSASTIPYDENWAFPVDSDILDTCYKDRDFYEPTEQINENFAYDIFNRLKENEILKKPKKEKKEKIYTEIPNHDDLIKEWANQNLYNDKRTLEDIYNDDKKSKKQRNLTLKHFSNRNLPWNIPDYQEYSNIPYLRRSYCYPKIMCNVGWEAMPVRTIVQYVKHGILLFLIDIRFGSPATHKKMVDHIQLARHSLSKGVFAERVFGFAFLIHGRKLRCGLLHKNQNIFLDRDSTIILTADRRWSNRGTHNIIYVNFSNYVSIIQIGDEIKIGLKIIVIVNGKTDSSVICTVKQDGLLKKRMAICLPINRRILPEQDITHEEEEDIGLAINLGCDYLISPCVTEKLISHINWVVAVRNRIVQVLQIIEFNETLTKERIDNILKLTNGVYIYSDGQNENNEIREYIISQTFLKHKLVVRAGFMDKKNCIQNFDKDTLKNLFLYPDCIVFSPCSYEMTEIRTVIRNIYPEMNYDTFHLSLGSMCNRDLSLENTFCKYIIISTFIYKIPFIAIVNNNGEFVKLLAGRRPLVPIVASFLDIPTARNWLISRNVYSVIHPTNSRTDWNEELSLRLRCCIKYAKMMRCIHRNEPFLFCYDSAPGLKYCDTVRLLLANKFL